MKRSGFQLETDLHADGLPLASGIWHPATIHRSRISMQITVNGEKKTCPDSMSLGSLLEVLGVNPRSVVVERNLQIVDRARLESESVQEGDHIEIIRFVGGG